MTAGLRPELEGVVRALLGATEAGGTLTLDELGEAIGERAVSPPEIDVMIARIEAAGRTVEERTAERGEDALKSVLTSARALLLELGRRPTPAEIAAHAGLSEASVRRALTLTKVMQR